MRAIVSVFSGLIFALVITTPAKSQNDPNIPLAKMEWEKLTSDRLNCMERGLRLNNTLVSVLIQNGIIPSDNRLAGFNKICDDVLALNLRKNYPCTLKSQNTNQTINTKCDEVLATDASGRWRIVDRNEAIELLFNKRNVKKAETEAFEARLNRESAEKENRRRVAEEQERKRQADETKQRRIAEEQEQKRKAEKAERQRIAEEQDRKRKLLVDEQQRTAEHSRGVGQDLSPVAKFLFDEFALTAPQTQKHTAVLSPVTYAKTNWERVAEKGLVGAIVGGALAVIAGLIGAIFGLFRWLRNHPIGDADETIEDGRSSFPLSGKPAEKLSTDGSSVDSAIVINARDTIEGIQAEYAYVASKHGAPEKDWNLQSQAVMEENRKHYDVFSVILRSGEVKTYYFDITSFYGSKLF